MITSSDIDNMFQKGCSAQDIVDAIVSIGDEALDFSKPHLGGGWSAKSSSVMSSRRGENALTAAGISYWIDKKRLVGEVTYSAEIAKQIKNAKVFLFISSANSNASTWTMNEIATANAYGKTIIPLLADHTPYNPAIMIYIAGIHYIDYASNPSQALNDLVRAIKAQK